MKVGDLVKGAYDKNKYRIGIVLRIAEPDQYGSFGLVANVLWNSTPVGLHQIGPAWVKDLELINEGR
jgi:hypothetical protein